eukprot:3233286-Rhodomonas_salina.1
MQYANADRGSLQTADGDKDMDMVAYQVLRDCLVARVEAEVSVLPDARRQRLASQKKSASHHRAEHGLISWKHSVPPHKEEHGLISQISHHKEQHSLAARAPRTRTPLTSQKKRVSHHITDRVSHRRRKNSVSHHRRKARRRRKHALLLRAIRIPHQRRTPQKNTAHGLGQPCV